eukprot:8111104-Prorocentrum_lima.AAC.1
MTLETLKNEPDRRFHNLDQKVAAAILAVCHRERTSGKSDPVRRDLAARIKRAEENSMQNGHMLGGREMLFLITSHYSVRQTLGQGYLFKDLAEIKMS